MGTLFSVAIRDGDLLLLSSYFTFLRRQEKSRLGRISLQWATYEPVCIIN